MFASQFEPGHAHKTLYQGVFGVELIISVSKRGDDVLICSMRPLESLTFITWNSSWTFSLI